MIPWAGWLLWKITVFIVQMEKISCSFSGSSVFTVKVFTSIKQIWRRLWENVNFFRWLLIWSQCAGEWGVTVCVHNRNNATDIASGENDCVSKQFSFSTIDKCKSAKFFVANLIHVFPNDIMSSLNTNVKLKRKLRKTCMKAALFKETRLHNFSFVHITGVT